MEEGVFLNAERVRLLGGPSVVLSCTAGSRVSRLVVGPCRGVEFLRGSDVMCRIGASSFAEWLF